MRRVELAGARGPVPGVLWERPGGTAEELGIVLPGAWFGCGPPPTSYATMVLQAHGADVFWVNYAYDREPAFDGLAQAEQHDWLFADARAGVNAALSGREYRRHVVVGKSYGTLAMSQLASEGWLPKLAKTVWLTPLLKEQRVRSSLEALTHPGLVVIGDADPHHDPAFLDRLAERRVCAVVVLEGANHGLNVGTDAAATVAALERYLSALAAFLTETGQR